MIKQITEEDVCKEVINMLSKERDVTKFGIERRSLSYSTLVYCDNDFFRVKYSGSSKWISIDLVKEDRNENDMRFAAQKKKTQRHWKAAINSIDDLKLFEKELLHACRYYFKEEYIPRERTQPIFLIK